MKIGFISSEYPHPKIGYSGGIGTSIFNLSKGLVSLGHEVVLFIYGQKEDELFYEKGIKFILIKNIKFKGISRYLTQKKIEKLINKNQLDIVEAPDWTGITSFIKPNCPVVIRLNGSDTYFCHFDNRKVKFRNKFHEERAIQKANGHIAVSQYTANITNQLFGFNHLYTVIHNSIDVGDFVEEKVEVNYQEQTILYFGTIIRKKGLLELPYIFNEVYKNNNKVKLILLGRDNPDIITGNSSTWAMMQPMFNEAAFQNVSYLGSVSYEEVKKYINQATICVFPTFAEALPVSWIEAMAMKKAIVASNIGWATEIITNNVDGFLEHPKNHSKFASKMMELLDNHLLQTQFGVEARKKIEQKFSIETIAEQSVAFYKKIIK